MNKQQFCGCPYVQEFISWAVKTLPSIKVKLKISRPGTGRVDGGLGPGIEGEFIGINEVVRAYHWRAAWKNLSGVTVSSDDWQTTQESLNQLRQWLQYEVKERNHKDALEATKSIIIWGGDRAYKKNPPAGALPFLMSLEDLPNYLMSAGDALNLETADTGKLKPILRMNAMLTKVHALMSDDGLPIYDSRVAGAIGCLVEIFRQSSGNLFDRLPETLAFKATDPVDRRRVQYLGSGPSRCFDQVLDPGVMNRANHEQCASEWASAKVRLGWLLSEIIKESDRQGSGLIPETFGEKNSSLPARMHAMEAALFMIGFSVDSLAVHLETEG